MAQYTVVLLRPEYLTDEYGLDIYVAHVTTKDVKWEANALRTAQKEVFDADTADGLGPLATTDYRLCVMFRGHHTPVGWGYGSQP